MDRVLSRILVAVGTDFAEKAKCRKSKGSLAMSINQGLVGPKSLLNCKRRKDRRLIFLHYLITSQEKLAR